MPDNWLDRGRTLLSRLPIVDLQSSQMSHFRFFPNQEKLHRIAVRQWEEQKRIRIIILKSRRVGGSSWTDGVFWCYGLAFPNKNMKIVADKSAASEELFRVPSDLSKNFPGFNSKNILGTKIFFPHKDGRSQIRIATAGTPSVGRGGTLAALHLSECAYFPVPSEGGTGMDSFTSILSSVSKGEGSIIVMESTANGVEYEGRAFYEYWNGAVERRNGFEPVFLTWLDDPMAVRHPEEAEDAPRDDLEKELMEPPYNATKGQIAWMRRTKAEDCKDDEIKWLVEFPHSPEVAFQVSGEPMFGREEIIYCQSTVRKPIARGTFRRSGSVIAFVPADEGPVHVWKHPKDARGAADRLHYYLGADAALGKDTGDFASYGVWCGETGEKACRFAERVNPEVFAEQIDLAGRYYNTAMVNLELTGNLGRWTLVKLRDVYRYPKLAPWKGRDDKKRGKDKSNSVCFEMNNATRQLIIDATRSRIRMGMRGEAGGLVCNDAMLVNQMSQATRKEWRWTVERGHDDVLVSDAIAILTSEQNPPPRMMFAPKILGDETPLEAVQRAVSAPIKTDDPRLDAEMRMFMRQAKTKFRNRLVGI